MVNNANLASTLGIPDSNILLKQNGDVKHKSQLKVGS